MSDEWDYYFANVNGATALVFADLGLRDEAPHPQRGWLLWVWVYLRHPDEEGLAAREEAESLHAIEDALVESVQNLTEAELVGCVTTAGRREFYFYGRRPLRFDEAVAAAMKRHTEYEFNLGTKDDAAWAHYVDNLYPAPEDLQQISNRHLLETLEEHGDDFDIPRSVTHWIDFATPENRSEFAAQVALDGFTITEESLAEDPAARLPYHLVIDRTDPVEWSHINQVTIGLFQLAHQFHGEYDGWETSVEGDGDGDDEYEEDDE